MFDSKFVAELAAQLAVRIVPQIHQANGSPKVWPRLMTVGEAAPYIGRTEAAVRQLIHKGELIVVRRGRRVHLDRADLDLWIQANKV